VDELKKDEEMLEVFDKQREDRSKLTSADIIDDMKKSDRVPLEKMDRLSLKQAKEVLVYLQKVSRKLLLVIRQHKKQWRRIPEDDMERQAEKRNLVTMIERAKTNLHTIDGFVTTIKDYGRSRSEYAKASGKKVRALIRKDPDTWRTSPEVSMLNVHQRADVRSFFLREARRARDKMSAAEDEMAELPEGPAKETQQRKLERLTAIEKESEANAGLMKELISAPPSSLPAPFPTPSTSVVPPAASPQNNPGPGDWASALPNP